MPDTAIAAAPASAMWMPSGVYLRRDEALRVTSYNALGSVALTIRTRIYRPDGTVADDVDAQTPNTDRTAKSTIVRTGDGWLLGGQVAVTSAAPVIGQTFVVVEVVRGESTAAIATQLLAAGYVTAKQPLPFPGRTIGASLDGAGALRSITGTTPAAGAEITETVPTGARWELIAFYARLTTAVAAANRIPTLVIDDGALNLGLITIAVLETASKAWVNTWGQGLALMTADVIGYLTAPLPVGLRLGAGSRIRTSTANIQAADQWGAIQYLVREWIEGA